MPYKDAEKQKAAQRKAMRRKRAEDRQKVVELPAGEVQLPDPPGRGELLRLLGAQARSGSVRALELLLKLNSGANTKKDQGANLWVTGAGPVEGCRSRCVRDRGVSR